MLLRDGSKDDTFTDKEVFAYINDVYSHRKVSNQIKNRYSDVLCLDQSRVRLCPLNNEDDEVRVMPFFLYDLLHDCHCSMQCFFSIVLFIYYYRI